MKRIVTITGPTCSGKSTLEQELADRGFGRVISHTSRAPRAGEVDSFGPKYYFTSRSVFSTDGDNFLESIEYDGNLYGVHQSEVTRLAELGYDELVIVAEPTGVRQVRNWCETRGIACLSIWLVVPSLVLYERFLARFSDEVGAARFLSGQRRADLTVTLCCGYASRLDVLLKEQACPTDVPWVRISGIAPLGLAATLIKSLKP